MNIATATQRPSAPSILFVAAGLAVGLVLALAGSAWGSFGIEKFENRLTMNVSGSPLNQAGSHPYAMTTTITFNHHQFEEEGIVKTYPDADPRNLEVNLPRGLVVNPNATGMKCTEHELESTAECPNSAAIGILNVESAVVNGPSPVFNMVAPPGVPAELGINLGGIGIVVHIEGRVRTGGDYGLSGDVSTISQKAGLYAATLTLWGSPADASHDRERGVCAYEGHKRIIEEEERVIIEHQGELFGSAFCAVPRTNRPLLTLPSSCAGPLVATVRADSWQEPEAWTPLQQSSPALPAVEGCSRLDFNPRVAVTLEPEASKSDSPTGLNFDLRIPQDESVGGLAEANLRNAVVTLPAGIAISPSAANGLGACTPEEIGLNTEKAPSCPDSSKIGETEILTPLLEQPLKGSVYLAQQGSNPFGSLLALYLVAEGNGALIKLAGQVAADSLTGQLATTFDDNPQLPFAELRLKLFGGSRAPLVTPMACGTYEATTLLSAWSGGAPAERSSSFTLGTGCGGGFAPSFSAGTVDNHAGAFSPLSVTFARQDGEQHLSSVRVVAPPGLLGVLKSVGRCPEPQAARGACGAESLIGHTMVGAGPGPDPLYVPGSVFLTGPYKGAPFGLSVVVPAVAGPFNLGNVIVRAAIRVDPHTAQVVVTSDPLPTILQGIPLDLKTVNVTVDRAGFTFNPTNCTHLAVAGTIGATGGASAAVSSPFEAANCASLKFAPKFSASTVGKATPNGQGAALHVDLSALEGPTDSGGVAGEANVKRVDVQLPKLLPARLTTLQKACTSVQFERDPAGCPEASFVGMAVAHTPILSHPLMGPAILVSHGGAAFPDLVIVLQGEGVRIDLVGNTQIKNGITYSRFDAVPDAPISNFELDLPQDPHSALAASSFSGFCGNTRLVSVHRRVTVRVHGRIRHALRSVKQLQVQPLSMPTMLEAQNGAVIHQTTQVAVTGCASLKAKNKARKVRKHGKHPSAAKRRK